MMRSRREMYIGNLYRNYGNLLKTFLIRRYGSEDFANEVSQETFCVACEKNAELLGHPCPQGWLYRTAENKAKELKRARFKIESHETEQNDNIIGDCTQLSEIEMKHVLKTVLSDEDYYMIVLRFKLKYNYREISDVYGISADACKKRVYRSLFCVKNYMQEN